jgi:hypothetical protein
MFAIASLHISYITDNIIKETELPASSFPLRFISIKYKTQNYTCVTPTLALVFIKAVAILFDATELAITNISLLDLLPDTIIYIPLYQSIFILG